MSFLLLGAVHWLRGFNQYLAFALMITGVVGSFFPFAFVLPLFIKFWRVLLGSQKVTDCSLYIGQRLRTSMNFRESPEALSNGSSTMAHWIVVADQGDDDYKVMHAIDDNGPVLSEKGKRITKCKEKSWIHSRYRLHHVGYAMKKSLDDHIKQVTKTEPMKSGYTCQEYAFDIAFQLSISRTYTYIKSFYLLRIRNCVCFCLLILSLAIKIAADIWKIQVIIIVPVSTGLFNPMTVLNVFAALESHRLGITNSITVKRTETSYQSFKGMLNGHFHSINNRSRFKLLMVAVCLAVVHIYVNDTLLTLSIIIVCHFCQAIAKKNEKWQFHENLEKLS